MKKVSDCCQSTMSLKPQENTVLHFPHCDKCLKPCNAVYPKIGLYRFGEAPKNDLFPMRMDSWHEEWYEINGNKHAMVVRKDDTKEQLEWVIKEHFDRVGAEFCICAAVVATDGTIIRGHRHSNALHTLRDMPGKEYQYGNGDTQGFITSRNRYVTREEGYKLQIAAGIKSADRSGDYVSKGELYSEDLY